MKVLLVVSSIVVPCHMVSRDTYNATARALAECQSGALLSVFTCMSSVKLAATRELPCWTDREAEAQCPQAVACLPF